MNYPIVEKKFIPPLTFSNGGKIYGDDSIKNKYTEVLYEVNKLKRRIIGLETEHFLVVGMVKYLENIYNLPILKEKLKNKEVELLKWEQKKEISFQNDIDNEKTSIKKHNTKIKHQLENEDWYIISTNCSTQCCSRKG